MATGWDTYKEILREAAAWANQPQAAACPQCGEPLETTPRGLHCRFDGYLAGR